MDCHYTCGLRKFSEKWETFVAVGFRMKKKRNGTQKSSEMGEVAGEREWRSNLEDV